MTDLWEFREHQGAGVGAADLVAVGVSRRPAGGAADGHGHVAAHRHRGFNAEVGGPGGGDVAGGGSALRHSRRCRGRPRGRSTRRAGRGRQHGGRLRPCFRRCCRRPRGPVGPGQGALAIRRRDRRAHGSAHRRGAAARGCVLRGTDRHPGGPAAVARSRRPDAPVGHHRRSARRRPPGGSLADPARRPPAQGAAPSRACLSAGPPGADDPIPSAAFPRGPRRPPARPTDKLRGPAGRSRRTGRPDRASSAGHPDGPGGDRQDPLGGGGRRRSCGGLPGRRVVGGARPAVRRQPGAPGGRRCPRPEQRPPRAAGPAEGVPG